MLAIEPQIHYFGGILGGLHNSNSTVAIYLGSVFKLLFISKLF